MIKAFIKRRTIDFSGALARGEIEREIEVAKAQKVLVCGDGVLPITQNGGGF